MLKFKSLRRFVVAACVSAAMLAAAAVRADEISDHNADLAKYKSELQTHNASVRYYDNDVGSHNSDVQRYDQNVKSHNQSISEYDADVRAHNSAVASHRSALQAWDREAASYESEVRSYNSLAPEKRTQFQKDRLDRWRTYLEQRRVELNRIGSNLNSRKSTLDNRKAYLDAKKRELDANKRRLDDRKADLDQRQAGINRRKQELDNWASTINRRAATLNAAQVAANQPPPTPPAGGGTTNKPQPGGRPSLPGFNTSVFGRGEGELQGGTKFPNARDASGKAVINDKEYDWSAKYDRDITNDANKLYRIQIWKFTCGKLGPPVEVEMKGSETGAVGDIYGWSIDANGERVKIVIGVQFSGDKVRFLTVRKAF